MNSKSKDTFTGGEIIESDDVWIINSIDWNGTGFRYGIFLKKDLGVLTQKALLGFASGVMIAAGVWSLIMPSIEMAEEQGTIPWLPAAVGFLLGIAFLLALDTLIPHLHVNDEKPEGPASNLKKSTMLVLAVTLHNIPEGIATSVPIYYSTGSRKRAFIVSFFSGITEPLGAIIGYLILRPFFNDVVFGILFGIIAGIMVFISIEELLPMAREYEKSKVTIIGVILGMAIIALSLLLFI